MNSQYTPFSEQFIPGNYGSYYAEEQPQDAEGWYEVSCMKAGVNNEHSTDPITALHFDPIKELIWAGTASGFLHAHYAEDMSRVVSTYLPQPVSDPKITTDVRDLIVSENLVLAAMGYGLASISRGGVIQASIRADAISDAKGIALNPHSDNHVIIGGQSPMLALIDLPNQRLLRQATLRGASGVTRALWASPETTSSLAIFSTSTGRISFCDPSTMREVNAVASFGGAITDISQSGHFLAATGLGTRSGLHYLEQSVKVFDIRRLETPLPSILFPAPPCYVTFDEYSSSRYNTNGALWILSPNGLLQCMDISSIASGTPAFPLTDPIQLDAGSDAFTGISVSSEGLVALGDTGGFVHQWTSATRARVNEQSEPIWMDPITTEPPKPSIDLTSLAQDDKGATIPKCAIPNYGKSYLSEDLFQNDNLYALKQGTITVKDSGDNMRSLYRRPHFARFPLRITDSILKTVKRQHSVVGYAPAPPGFVRNSESGHEKSPYVKGMYGKDGRGAYRSYGTSEHPGSSRKSPSKEVDLSKPHGRSQYVEMDLVAWESIEGFNFLKYNKSALFCGLENALPNVYVNAVVQILYFTPPLRRAIAKHSCDRPWCITCELGFLFHMFDLGGAGMACEAGNFTRAFMTMANAGALGLLDGPHALQLSQRIENFSRYLLEQLRKDEHLAYEGTVASLFGSLTVSQGKFTPSGSAWERRSRPFQHTLVYDHGNDVPFCELLERSLSYSLDPTKAFCEKTGQFELMTQKRELKTAPNLLLLGCNTKAGGYEKWWFGENNSPVMSSRKQNGNAYVSLNVEQAANEALSSRPKLIESIRVDLNDGVSVVELESDDGQDVSIERNEGSNFGYDRADKEDVSIEDLGDKVGEYDLSFVVVHVPRPEGGIKDGINGSSGGRNVDGHLVAYVRVPREYRNEEKAAKSVAAGAGNVDAKWWCFNDFVISGCDGFEEVGCFHKMWKKPCLLGYVRRDVCKRVVGPQMKKCVKIREVIGGEDDGENEAIGLQDDEATPGKGTILGLDCEFVMVGREDAEIFGDGTRRVMVPARMALARVSVVRGYGRLKGKALIDDYVAVREPVVDYLTRFSGLREGDLDVGRSEYRVRPLKSVYKRLRSLVDAGCTFVGHGLKSDFRIINFVVPPEQVIDTVTLFRVKNKRLLGLRFLNKTLLGGDIQGVTHDSIEDSNAALELYEMYRKLKGENGGKDVFDKTLKDLYTYGYAKGWKVDEEDKFIIDWEGGGIEEGLMRSAEIRSVGGGEGGGDGLR